MRKGLLGTVNNITSNLNKIKVWANSLKNVSNADILLITINATNNEINLLESMGIEVSPYDIQTNETINNKRLYYQIKTLTKQDWDYVLVTDVFDVVFQRDPFDKIINTTGDIVIGNEGIKHNEEPWNLDVTNKCYPEYVELLRDKYIYCSGVMGGKKHTMIHLLQMMDTITDSGLKGHDIRDQAALNIILQDNPIFNITGYTPKSGWVLHCATGGPTQVYKPWGFDKLYRQRWGEAKMVDGIVTTADGTPYDIVHQFNRISEWNKILTFGYDK